MPKKLLAGKSPRIVITMGMPVLVYRWFFRRSLSQEPETQHSRVLRLSPYPAEPDRNGGVRQRRRALRMPMVWQLCRFHRSLKRRPREGRDPATFFVHDKRSFWGPPEVLRMRPEIR
jgi:hypothetical protein